MKDFNPDMSVRKLDTILGFRPPPFRILNPYKELFDIPYDMPYGKTLTDEQSIQFPLCIAAAIHCRWILVY